MKAIHFKKFNTSLIIVCDDVQDDENDYTVTPTEFARFVEDVKAGNYDQLTTDAIAWGK